MSPLPLLEPLDEDIEDAVVYINDTTEKFPPVNRWDLRLEEVMLMDPADFVVDSSHLGEESGWLKKFPKREWVEKLRSAYDRDFSHIINQWKTKTLHPGIQIDDDFGDGSGRAKFLWSIGEKVPVARFKSVRANSLDEDLRRLERAASTGDQDAQRRLELARARLAPPPPAPMDHALATRLKAIAWDRSDRGLEPKAQKLTGAIAKDVVFAYFIGQGWKRDERAGYNYQDNLLSPNEQQKVQFEKTVTHFYAGGRGKWVKDGRGGSLRSDSTIKIAEMLLSEAYRILGEGGEIGKIRERQEKQKAQTADRAWRREVDRLASRIVNVEASKLASPQGAS